MTNLQTWSDEELCQFCIPKHWEHRMAFDGCIAVPLSSAVLLFLWYMPWRKSISFLEGTAIWVAGMVVLFWVKQVIAGWRCRRHKAELAHRYGQRPFNGYRTKARRELRRKAASKIYLFQGRDVKGQQYAFVKITLWATEPASGRLTVRIAPDFLTTDFRTVFFKLVKPKTSFRTVSVKLVNHERELTQEEATELLTERAGSAGSRLRSAPKSKKGYACSVATLEPSRESTATCDLLSTTVSEAELSTLQLTLRLLHLAETVTDHPLVSHWEMPDEKKEPFRLDMSEESAKFLFEELDPPDWVILFSGRALPHGGHYLLRVVLSEAAPPWGRLWTIAHAHERFNYRDPRSTKKYHEKELNTAEYRSLLDGLHDVTPRVDLKLTSFVRDGLPCDLVVLRRSPSEVTRAKCNLVGLTESEAQEPLVKLMRMLLDLRREAGASPALYGAYVPTGNIYIDAI